MKFYASIEIEVPDSAVEFVGSGKLAGSLVTRLHRAMEDQREQYPDFIESFDVQVEVGGAKHGLGWSESSPKDELVTIATARKPADKPDFTDSRTARVAALPKSQTSGKRMGRPATLKHLEASDGQPVRERGDRSPESLHAAGISTREVGGNGEWTPPLPERKPRKATAPVSKGYGSAPRPTVVSKRRGQ